MKVKKTETTALYAIIIVFIIAIDLILGGLMLRESQRAMISLIHSRMLDISNTAAAMIDGDELKSMEPEKSQTKEYKKIMWILSSFMENIELKYIYCIQDEGNGKFTFGLDPTVEDPAGFGTPVVRTDALVNASQGTADVDRKSYEDKWGEFYSAYSPVFDSQGNVAGIVAVDFDRKWYDRQVNSLINTTLFVSLGSLVVGSSLAVAVLNKKRRRILKVHNQLNEFAVNVENLIDELGGTSANALEHCADMEELTRVESGEIGSLGDKVLYLEEELRQRIELIKKQAYVDGLTGVKNMNSYRGILKELERMIDDGNAAFTMIALDMNGLKGINDNYGHEQGNQALITAAKALTRLFGYESVYRVGGDEFVVVLKNAEEQRVKVALAGLEDAVAAERTELLRPEVEISLARGYASYGPETTGGFREVFRLADAMMYEEKRAYHAGRKARG